MQKFMTIAEELDLSDKSAVLEKEHNTHKIKRNKLKNKGKNRKLAVENSSGGYIMQKSDIDNKTGDVNKTDNQDHPDQSHSKKEHVLRRKRYHNFTPNLMAHEFLAFRRVDRFYHKSTKKRISSQVCLFINILYMHT